MPPGSTKVGLTKDNQPSKVVWELDYGLSDEQFQKLSKRFPGIAFVQTGIGCHDHPIAHTSYRVVWENVIKQLKPGQKVADVSGNPAFNEQFNKSQKGRKSPITIDTFCKVVSTKDSIRAKTRWGPAVADGVTRWEEMTLYDMYRFEENRQRFATYDVFLLNHVLYYYKMSEVCALLNMNPNAVLYATIHKLEGQKGSINCGEQSFEKDLVSGRVSQVNVETGEVYAHPDPAPWFKKFAYADVNGAFAWTVTKGCDDTYIITATATDPRLVEEGCWKDGRVVHPDPTSKMGYTCSEPTTLVVGDPPPAYGVEEVELTTKFLLPDALEVKTVNIKITHPELYRKLCHFMINKPRNVRTLQDLTAKAHREVGNNMVYGGGAKVEIEPSVLVKHITAAWSSGANLEDEMFQAAMGQASTLQSVNRNLSGKSLVFNKDTAVKQGLRFALLAKSVTGHPDTTRAVLEQLDELL